MPNEGSAPTPLQRQKFREYIEGKNLVTGVQEPSDSVFRITRRRMSTVVAVLVDIYTVSESDVMEIRAEHPDVTAIITSSVWNQYTDEAKQCGREHGIGVFEWREFMKAVHTDGDVFLASKA